MKLPIDISAVMKAATHLDEVSDTPLAVSVYLDESAPKDLVAHVRSSYASAHPNARVSITYLDGPLSTRTEEDMAVIVAGDSVGVGRLAAQIREDGIPVMVVSTSPRKVNQAADQSGFEIPDGDLVFPELPPMKQKISELIQGDKYIALDAVEPIVLDKKATAALDDRMGRWIIAACASKKLAFALAFSFVRRPLSEDSVTTTSLQNAGIGAAMFIPGADLPLMTLNQAKMLLQIAAAYGEPMNLDRVKELAMVVGGAFLCRNLARQLCGLVPALGWAIKGAVGYGGTLAVGQAAIEYFESGGDLVGLAAVVQKARDGAVEVVQTAAKSDVLKNAVSGIKSKIQRS